LNFIATPNLVLAREIELIDFLAFYLNGSKGNYRPFLLKKRGAAALCLSGLRVGKLTFDVISKSNGQTF